MKPIFSLFGTTSIPALAIILASCQPVENKAAATKPSINNSPVTPSAPIVADLLKGDLSKNWRGFKSQEVPLGWTLSGGVLTFKPMSKEAKAEARAAGKKAGGDLVSLQTFDDFELNMEWKITKGGNSGIFVRANEQFGKPWHSSIEVQILDHTGVDMNDPKQALHNAGAIYDLYPAHPKSFVPVGEWNHVTIRMVGTRITVTQNSQLVADVDMSSEEYKAKFQASKFQRMAPKSGSFSSGFIGLQDHGGECSYRNIKVTKL